MSFKTKLLFIPVTVTIMMSLTIAAAWWGAGSLEPFMVKIWLSVVVFALNMPFLIYNGLKLGWKFFLGLILLLLVINQIQDHFTGERGVESGRHGTEMALVHSRLCCSESCGLHNRLVQRLTKVTRAQ